VTDGFDISRELPAVVFVNPDAGAGRAGARLPEIREVFASHRIPAEFLITDSALSLESLAHGAMDDGRRLLLTVGGDGTFQALANACFGRDVLLGVLPAGGGNDFASALGLPRDPIDAARCVLRGRPRVVDLLRARTSDGVERLYVGGGGIGLDVDAAWHASNIYRRWPGRLRYIAGLLRAFREFAPLQVSAQFPNGDASPMEENVLLAAVFNTPSYGAGIRLAPRATLDDGCLDVVFVRDLSALKVLVALPRLLRAGTLHETHLKRERSRCVVLSPNRPCVFHGDGEILGAAPVEIEVVRRAIRVLAPRAV
jgi:diacylglycerol kinase (ATP)